MKSLVSELHLHSLILPAYGADVGTIQIQARVLCYTTCSNDSQ